MVHLQRRPVGTCQQRWLSANPLDRGERGRLAEAFARDALLRGGLKPVAANVNYRGGELDLVMLDGSGREGDTLVFVEVRARRGAAQGGAAATVGAAKQRRLVLAAQHYLARLAAPPPCRFDVVAIDGGEIEWLRAAFDAA